jgi:rifampicin phosphotransferase
MAETESKIALTFEPPGPGSWDLDPVHFPRPVTRYWAQMHPSAFFEGYAQMMAFFGLPIAGRRTVYVQGFAYGQMQPCAPEEVPQRFQRAAEVFANKLWRDQVKEWDEVCKPASIRAHLDIQAVDPDLLSDDELASYLRRCRDHHAAMITQHMRFTGTASIPPGDLLVHAGEWTGLPPAELLGMMRGASPVSGGGTPQGDRLVAAFRADHAATERLHSTEEAGKLLEDLRNEDSDAGRALSDYLDFTGYRLLDGFDISGRYALELPDVLLRSIRSSIEGRDDMQPDVDVQIASVRQRVPEAHRAQFDELLQEARLGYRIRDERGVYSDIWAAGLMRRSAIAAGKRLTARGRLRSAEDFVFADIDEMCGLLAGEATPDADELSARHRFHKMYTAKDAPAHLGDPPSPMPDPASLPPDAARMLRAVGTAMGHMFAESEEAHESNVIRGLSASGGVAEGPARRVNGPSDFDRIQQGDVLVTEATTEAFNILLPLLSAIVTDSGGALSHAAIVAREYGIPGVVGTRDATAQIPDGARVRVDGSAGHVTVLG